MRKLVIALSVVVFFILQSTMFLNINNSMIVPNLLVVLTSTMGIMHGKKTGMIVGFCCGLLTDLMFSSVIGINALLLTYIGLGNGCLNSIFNPEALKLPIFMITISDIAYSVLYYMLLFLLRTRYDILNYARYIMVPELILTVIATIILYPIILQIYKAFERGQKGRRADGD